MFKKKESDVLNMFIDLENDLIEVKREIYKQQANTDTMIEQAVSEATTLQKELDKAKKELGETKQELDETKKELGETKQELDEANQEILRLKTIISKDSSNSHKPSSTNGFKHVPNSREKTGRKQGGQFGHPGHRLGLPENLDELEEEGVIERRTIDHTDGASEYVIRYTLDLETKVIVTEHRFKVGEIPQERYNEVTYGDGIKGMSVVMLNEGIIAKKRLTEIFSGMTSGLINLSTGTLESFQIEFAKKLDELNEIESIETDLLNGEVMHSDDTPLRVLERPLHKDGDLVYETTEDGNQEILIEKAEGKTFQATARTYAKKLAQDIRSIQANIKRA